MSSPVLPGAVVSVLYLHLGWGVVLAWLGRRWGGWWAAGIMALWAWLPGPWGPTHWLGLAFQSPSVLAVVWCAYALWGQCGRATAPGPASAAVPMFALVWSTILGWVLLVDVLAWLPVSVYAWGFSPVALGVLLALALVPMAVPGLRAGPGSSAGQGWMLWPLALGCFVALRLPSGNAWDAVLDPWLWMVGHIVAYRQWQQWRAARKTHGPLLEERKP